MATFFLFASLILNLLQYKRFKNKDKELQESKDHINCVEQMFKNLYYKSKNK